MMHTAWCTTEEVSYCFPRPSIKFQGHTGQKINNFDPNRAFPDCNFSLIHQWIEMMHKAIEELPYRGHRSIVKVTRAEKSNLSNILGRSQLSNLLDLPSCYYYFIFSIIITWGKCYWYIFLKTAVFKTIYILNHTNYRWQFLAIYIVIFTINRTWSRVENQCCYWD